MLVLGNDPGETNFGYAIVDIAKREIYEIGQITKTIRNLTPKPMDVRTKAQKTKDKKAQRKVAPEHMLPPFRDNFRIFRNNFIRIFRDYPDITEVYSERFQTRGVKSRSVETVSMMNGVVATLAYNKRVAYQPTMAATWKNRVNKTFDLEAAYTMAGQYGFTPHELDATLIAFTRGGQDDPPSYKQLKRALKVYSECLE